MTIRLLSPEVQQRIAAGEVVERPASVLKELLENALDAGAESLQVDVKEGGRRLIQVTDDGSGIGADEVPLAFSRFATSKIARIEDLSALRSFGFRGEALASIASASRLRFVTRSRNALLGTEARLEGGRMLSLQEAGAPVGTRVEVWDLFHNLPARQKFLRSLKTEYRHILRTFTASALAYPEKRFSLLLDGREVYTLPPATPAQRLANAFGQQASSQLEEFDAVGSWGRAWGFVLPSENASPRRAYLYVNRRPVRNAMLYRAVWDGLEQRAGTAVLFLELAPAHIDINAHPAKLEVRFRDGQEVYEQVRYALARRRHNQATFDLSAAEPQGAYEIPKTYTLIGQLENTFLLFLFEGHLYLLDQHAAEERVFYEKLQQGKVGRRDLVAPQVVNVSPSEQAVIEAQRERLTACGFVMEAFGPQVLALRAIPEFLLPKESGWIFSHMLTRVRSEREDCWQALSCLGAVKAGETLAPESQERLLAAWMQTQNPHACAHNRPVYFRVSLDEVKRKVGRTGASCEFEQRR